MLESRPQGLQLQPLVGRVEDWRAGLGRSLGSLLSRPFVCECPTISTETISKLVVAAIPRGKAGALIAQRGAPLHLVPQLNNDPDSSLSWPSGAS